MAPEAADLLTNALALTVRERALIARELLPEPGRGGDGDAAEAWGRRTGAAQSRCPVRLGRHRGLGSGQGAPRAALASPVERADPPPSWNRGPDGLASARPGLSPRRSEFANEILGWGRAAGRDLLLGPLERGMKPGTFVVRHVRERVDPVEARVGSLTAWRSLGPGCSCGNPIDRWERRPSGTPAPRRGRLSRRPHRRGCPRRLGPGGSPAGSPKLQPSATRSRMNSTESRVPRTTGLPTRTAGIDGNALAPVSSHGTRGSQGRPRMPSTCLMSGGRSVVTTSSSTSRSTSK